MKTKFKGFTWYLDECGDLVRWRSEDISHCSYEIYKRNEEDYEPPRPRATGGETYYYIENGKVKSANELYFNIDDERYAVGNYFLNEAECQIYARAYSEILQGRTLERGEK